MAAGTRGKLKENCEGIHRNIDWIKFHCEKSLMLLPDGYLQLQDSFNAVIKIADQLDDFNQGIYSHL